MPKSTLVNVSQSHVDSLEQSLKNLSHKVDSLTATTHDMGIRSDFFGDAIAAQTAFFSLIVSLIFGTIALLSWQYLYKPLRKKQSELKVYLENIESNLKADFASFSTTLEDRIKTSELEIQKISYHAGFAIYTYADGIKDSTSSLYWLLYICDKFETVDQKIAVIPNAFKYLSPELNNRKKHQEISGMITKLKSVDNDDFKKTVEKLEVEYMQAAFSIPDVKE